MHIKSNVLKTKLGRLIRKPGCTVVLFTQMSSLGFGKIGYAFEQVFDLNYAIKTSLYIKHLKHLVIFFKHHHNYH